MNMLFCCLHCSYLIYSTNFPLLSESRMLPLTHFVNTEDLKQGLHFKYDPRTHDVQWKEGMNYFCWHENDCIDCYIEPWRSVVKVEPWNMIRPCRNLQLQIVWNWLGVLVLFGRLTAIGSIYLLRTTKVSGNTERGSWTVIFLLFTFFVCPRLVVCWGFQSRRQFQGFPCLFLVVLWRWTEHVYFWQTPKFHVVSTLPRSPPYPSVDSNEFDGCF